MNDFARQFARHVVREEEQLTLFSSVPHIQKERERIVREILGRRVYCHFERIGGRLICAFAHEPKYLLGEIVRDWLQIEHRTNDFLWCQKSNGEYAMALVLGGRVVQEGIDVKPSSLVLAHKQLVDSAGERARAFLHRSVPDGIVPSESTTRLERSLQLQLEATGGALPKLVAIDEIVSVRRWNLLWGWFRRISIVVAVAVGGTAAWMWWQDRVPEPAVPADQGPRITEAEYGNLLRAPDVGALLPAIHRAYREVLADPFFGEHWNVQSLAWQRPRGARPQDAPPSGGGELTITAALPLLSLSPVPGEREAPAAAPFELPDELQGEVGAYARSKNWRVEVRGSTVTLRVPVQVSLTDANAAAALRIPEVDAEHPWHRERLLEDLSILGDARVRNALDRQVFRAYSMMLGLAGAEWSTGDLASWLGQRLSGGPIVLESMRLALEGARATGEINFWTVWCVARDTNRCDGQATVQ